MNLQVLNRQRLCKLDCRALAGFGKRAAEVCLQLRPGTVFPGEVLVILVSDRRIAALHRRFMHVPGPTDVITFHHGEIFISVQTALRQAGSYGTSLLAEVRLYLVHGLLHLLGCQDRTAAQARTIKGLQDRVISMI